MKRYLYTLFIIAMFNATPSRAEVFTLEQCKEAAVKNNRKLQNARMEIEASSEQEKEIRAKYYPQISLNLLAFHAFDKIIKSDGVFPAEMAALAQINPAFAEMAGQPYSFKELDRGYTASLTAMIPLYAGGQITTGNKLAKIGSDVSRLQLGMSEKEVERKISENFWQVAQVKYNLQTIAKAEEQMDAVMQQVTNYVNAGVTTRNALLKVKLRKQELASNRLKAENAQRILLMLLAQQVGAESEGFDISVPSVDSVDFSQAIQQRDGAAARTELKLVSKNVEAQQLQVKMERGKLLPTVAVGLVGFHSDMGGFSGMVSKYAPTPMTNMLALATVSVPISDWWGGIHTIRRARIKLQQAENDYNEAMEKLHIETESAWLNVTESYKQIEIAKSSVEEAEENYRMSLNLYNAGKETITDLLSAETLLRQSKDQLSCAVADYYIRLADYQYKVK